MPFDIASNKSSSKTSKICFLFKMVSKTKKWLLIEWVSEKGWCIRLSTEPGQEAAHQDGMKKINRK